MRARSERVLHRRSPHLEAASIVKKRGVANRLTRASVGDFVTERNGKGVAKRIETECAPGQGVRLVADPGKSGAGRSAPDVRT